MKINIKDLVLDNENERFVNPFKSELDEQDIFNYLYEYEVLNELILSIQKSGFFQIGERIIVSPIADSKKYVVLEGNRRICALKALHGFYNKQYKFDDAFKTNSEVIECDIVSSKEEVLAYLAARHIQGMQQWKPESRRNFYFKHYENGKSVTYIERITGQPKSEIKKFIKESIFFKFYKIYADTRKIDKPSLIYERVKNYSIEMGIINDYEVSEYYQSTYIQVNNRILDNDSAKKFYLNLNDAIYGENKIINSRTMNTYNDFTKVLTGESIKNYFPELFKISKEIFDKQTLLHYRPYQKIYSEIVGRISPINKIIDYSPISENAIIQITDCDGALIDLEDFYVGKVGKYQISVNSSIFHFDILDLSMPQIFINNDLLNNLPINNTITLYDKIKIIDVYNQYVDLKSSKVTFESLSDKVTISSNKSLTINEAGTYIIRVRYKHNQDYIKEEAFTVIGKPNVIEKKQGKISRFFDFKFLEVSSILESRLTGKLLTELDLSYEQKRLHIFTSALRSLVELVVEDFLHSAELRKPTSKWSCEKLDKLKHVISETTSDEYRSICAKFSNYMLKNYSIIIDTQSLKNYFETNLTLDRMNSLISGLHLGAHKSLRNLFDGNLISFQPTIVSLIELLIIVEEIGFE